MLKSKKGMNTANIEGYIVGFIGIVILFKVVAATFPTLVASGNELNASGIPLGTLFAGSGAVVWLILGAVLVVVAVKLLFGLGKKTK